MRGPHPGAGRRASVVETGSALGADGLPTATYAELMRQQTDGPASTELQFRRGRHGYGPTYHVSADGLSEPQLSTGLVMVTVTAPPAPADDRRTSGSTWVRLAVWVRLLGLVGPVKLAVPGSPWPSASLHHGSVIVLGAVSCAAGGLPCSGATTINDTGAHHPGMPSSLRSRRCSTYLESWQAHDMALQAAGEACATSFYEMLEPLAPAYMVRRRSGRRREHRRAETSRPSSTSSPTRCRR